MKCYQLHAAQRQLLRPLNKFVRQKSSFIKIFKTNNIGVIADIFYAPNLPTKAAAFQMVIEAEEK